MKYTWKLGKCIVALSTPIIDSAIGNGGNDLQATRYLKLPSLPSLLDLLKFLDLPKLPDLPNFLALPELPALHNIREILINLFEYLKVAAVHSGLLELRCR